MSNFVVQFLLKTEKFQEDVLNKRFKIARQMYNCLVTITQNRYKEVTKTKKYKQLLSKLSEDKNENKFIFNQIQQMRKDFGLTEYSFHCDVKKIQKHFKDNIDSFTAQKIATTLWKAYDKLFYGNGKHIYYKKYGTLNSLEGKSCL